MLPLIRSHAAYERGETSVSVAALRSALEPPFLLLGWVAMQAGQLVGYATATLDFSTWTGRSFLHLDCLFVQEGCRGGGIGAALLEAVRAHAAEREISEMQWQTPNWNKDAIRFYLREGAVMVPKERFTLRIMQAHILDQRSQSRPLPALA
ncbi:MULTISPECIES: GNAT family N-acetyltransferase [unclassified Sphingomonas]|uniref:GNAT family N-acetyltransferase n=1 Tax=unclassified Sphingomonas TaxID=196159 RepID=UPI00226A90D9|nr:MULTISPECIES: GNAT family N-acetyltransferase [unclassified Sphingomonas]